MTSLSGPTFPRRLTPPSSKADLSPPSGPTSTTGVPVRPDQKKQNLVLFDKEREARDRKEEVNRKIASQKALSVILRREATKAVLDKKKKKGISPKRLLPRTVLEALHDRITALRWDSALKLACRFQEPS